MLETYSAVFGGYYRLPARICQWTPPTHACVVPQTRAVERHRRRLVARAHGGRQRGILGVSSGQLGTKLGRRGRDERWVWGWEGGVGGRGVRRMKDRKTERGTHKKARDNTLNGNMGRVGIEILHARIDKDTG